jgi:hypothetical protein
VVGYNDRLLQHQYNHYILFLARFSRRSSPTSKHFTRKHSYRYSNAPTSTAQSRKIQPMHGK